MTELSYIEEFLTALRDGDDTFVSFVKTKGIDKMDTAQQIQLMTLVCDLFTQENTVLLQRWLPLFYETLLETKSLYSFVAQSIEQRIHQPSVHALLADTDVAFFVVEPFITKNDVEAIQWIVQQPIGNPFVLMFASTRHAFDIVNHCLSFETVEKQKGFIKSMQRSNLQNETRTFYNKKLFELEALEQKERLTHTLEQNVDTQTFNTKRKL